MFNFSIKYRILFSTLIVILMIAGGCDTPAKKSTPPKAIQGVLDLTTWDFEKDGPVNLDGEYEFYWRRLLTDNDFHPDRPNLSPDYISVPRSWNRFDYQGKSLGGDGFATYRLTVKTQKRERPLALSLLRLSTSYRLLINGNELLAAGIVGKEKAATKPGFNPKLAIFMIDSETFEVIIQVANFSHRLGGARNKILIGTPEQLQSKREINIVFDIFLFGSIMMMALYHLALFSLRREEKTSLYFGLLCLLIAFRLLTTGERYFLILFPEIGYEALVKLEYLTFYLSVVAFLHYFYSIYSKRFSKNVYIWATIIGLLSSAIVIVSPVKLFSHTMVFYELFTLLLVGYATILLILTSFKKDISAIIFLAGFSILCVFTVNDILYSRGIIQTRFLVPFGVFIFIFSQAYLITRYFSEAFDTVEAQSVILRKTNIDYLKEIDERKKAQRESKKAMRAAEIASQAKSDFLANMSHELRTPLNHIIGFTELILDKHFGKLTQTQEEYLKDVHGSGEHLLSLINDILDITKIEAGKLEYTPTTVDLRDILTKSQDIIGEKALKAGIRLINKIDDDAPDLVSCDERKLKQILYNLLSNAVKFTPDGGEIVLVARRCHQSDVKDMKENEPQKQMLLISVKDTGIGIRKEDFERIFQPFEQVENSTSRRFPGTGLGLSLARRLIQLHGGTIWVESEGEGNGTTFHFTLPL